jgi:hypothetical protein
MICTQFLVLCWYETILFNLYNSQIKIFQNVLSDYNLYKQLEKKV